MIALQVVVAMVDVDLTSGDFDRPRPDVSAVIAVAGAGKVGVTLGDGSSGVIYLAQGQVFRADIASIIAADTDSVFKAASGDLVMLVDRLI